MVGGTIPSRIASTVATASTAAAAPIMWPVIDFVELTDTLRENSGPMTSLMTRVSVLSLSGVEVPWALM